MQVLYDYTSSESTAHLAGVKPAAATASGVLTELHVEGFDAEQIWLQLDMASAQLVRRAKRLLKKAGTDPSLLTPDMEEDLTGQQSQYPLAIKTPEAVLHASQCILYKNQEHQTCHTIAAIP